MDFDNTIARKELLQDFWKRIGGVEKVFRKKDIKKLYKDRDPPLSELELDFLYKSYTDNMSVFLSSTDVPDSLFNTDNYRTLEEAKLNEEDTKAAVQEASALGLINRSMHRMEALAIVVKYQKSCCDKCKKRKIDLQRCPCNTVRYCNQECQRDHWVEHKKVCTAKSKKIKVNL